MTTAPRSRTGQTPAEPLPADAASAEAAFGLRLRRAREQEGVSLREMARRLTRSHSNLWDYERGHRLATFEVAAEYERELGLAEGELQVPLEQARREVYGLDRDRRRPFRPPQPVVPPTRPPAAPRATAPPAGPFVGRDQELESAGTWLAEARAGEPRVIVVGGEAGIGKSTLLAHLLARARAAGWLALTGSCLQGARIAYLPVATALAPLMPEPFLGQTGLDPNRSFASEPDIAADRRHLDLMMSLTGALLEAADRGPLLLAIEDLHWADQSTLGFLELLAAVVSQKAALTPVPLVLLLSGRHTHEGEADWRLVQRLRREGIYRELKLKALDSLEINQVVTELGSGRPTRTLLRSLAGASQGNPLLLRSLLDRLMTEGRIAAAGGLLSEQEADLPAVVLDLDSELSARLERVDPACADLLQWAALLGDGQPLALLRAVGGYGDDEFDRLIGVAAGARVLYEDGDLYRFDHPELREVLYARLPARQRRRKHLAIAGHLEQEAGGSGSGPPAVAHHLYRAGPEAPPSRLVRAARAAAEQSFALAAWAEAAWYYDMCLGAEQSGPADPYLLWCAGVAHYRNHDHQRSEDRLVAAVDAARQAGDERLWGRAALALTKTRVTGGAGLGADVDLEPLQEFLRESHEETAADLRARAFSLVADAHFAMFEFAAGFEQAQRALDAATDITDDEVVAEVELALGVQYLAGLQLDHSEQHLRNCERSAARLRDTWGTGWAASRLPLIALCRGDLGGADVQAAKAATVASEHFDWAESSLAIACRVAVAVAQGRGAQAERLGTLAHQQYLRSDYPWTVLVLAPALLVGRAQRGEPAGVQEAIAMIGQTGVDTRWFDLAARAVLGDLQDGAALRAQGSTPPYSLFDLGFAALQAEVCDITGDADLARAALGPLQTAQLAGFAQVVGWVASVPRLLGVVCRCLGQLDDAERWLRSALTETERAPAPAELARVHLNLAHVLLQRGEPEAAGDAMDQAAGAFRQLGLVALEKRTDRLRQEQQQIVSQPRH